MYPIMLHQLTDVQQHMRKRSLLLQHKAITNLSETWKMEKYCITERYEKKMSLLDVAIKDMVIRPLARATVRPLARATVRCAYFFLCSGLG